MDSLFDLPNELLLLILEYLDVETMIKLGQTHSKLYHLVITPAVLHRLSLQIGIPETSTWPDFLKYYDSDYISKRSRHHLNNSQCLRLSAKAGRLDLIQHYCPNIEPSVIVSESIVEAIIVAAKYGHEGIVRYLMEYYDGCDCGKIMVAAARGGCIEIIEDLIADVVNDEGETVDCGAIARAAAWGNHPEIINWMCRVAEVDALEIACGAARGGHRYLIEEMLPYGIRSHLHLLLAEAAVGGHLDLMVYLQSLQSNVNLNPALVAAAKKGHTPIIHHLLQQSFSFTTMLEAARQCACRGHLATLQLLIDTSTPPMDNFCSILTCILTVGPRYMGRNPYRARARYLAICRYLLPKIESPSLPSIVELMAENGSEELLSDYEATHSQAIMKGAAKGGHLELVHRMLQLNATNPSSVINYDACMLAAATHGHLEIIDLMLGWGATNYHETMLEAIRRGHLPVVQAMDARCLELRNTYLVVAAEYNQIIVVKYFIDQGAINFNEGLITAAGEGHLAIVRLLLNHGATSYGMAIIVASHPVVTTTAHREIIALLRCYKSRSVT